MKRYITEECMESERELRRLQRYILDYPEDWEIITDMESCGLSARQRLEIMERLEQAGLLAVAYVVLYLAGDKSREMELVRNRISGEIAISSSVENLFSIVKKVMEDNVD